MAWTVAVAVAAAVWVACRPAPGPSRPVPRPLPGRREPNRWDPVEFHAQLAALAGAGLTPAQALRQVADGCGQQDVRRLLLDLAAGFAGSAVRDDELQLRPLRATLAVVSATGAPAGQTLARLAVAAAEEDDARLAVRSALAAPKATARVLTALPVFGLLMGHLMGADPLAVLVGTGPGRVSALVGGLCAVAGAVWTRRLVAAATAPS